MVKTGALQSLLIRPPEVQIVKIKIQNFCLALDFLLVQNLVSVCR